ncbi:MAG: hypothetical protein ACRD9R_13505, partial [Pyrinomonadaceae bacterium]
MPDETQSTRERVRALVREVLNNTLPAEEGSEPSAPRPSAPAAGDSTAAARPASRFVDMAATKREPEEQDFARDESAKTVITESDVSGLAEGSRLRVAEGARLT